MKRALAGLAVAAALLASGNGFSAEKHRGGKPPKTPESTEAKAPEQQLTGKVLHATKDKVTIEYNGAAIPFNVDKNTRVDGAKTVAALTQGQNVRANFEMRNTKNELKSISVLPGEATGGTGLEKAREKVEKKLEREKEEHSHDKNR